MSDLDKLLQIVGETKRIHERMGAPDGKPTTMQHVLNGAIVEALDVVASMLSRQSTPETVRPSEPVNVAHKFDSGLVERLAQAAWTSDVRNDGLPWKLVNDAAKDNVRRHVLATLSELAKAPVELPMQHEVSAAWYGQDVYDHKPDMSAARRVLKLLVPILAAKDARVAELEKQLEELDRERLTAIEDRKRAEAKVRAWEARTGETQPRIVEMQLMPVDANGKTPGQVAHEGYEVDVDGVVIEKTPWHELPESMRKRSESSASAVLRAFGGEALRRIRRFVDTTSIPWGDGSVIRSADVIKKIDAELAELGVSGG